MNELILALIGALAVGLIVYVAIMENEDE